jgi:hypothetical protein
MNRNDALEYVAFVVDDAGCGRRLHDDRFAIVREGCGSCRNELTGSVSEDPDDGPYRHPSVLVGWQCGFEPMFVAVHSYLDVAIDDADAEEIAQEYLAELGWFSDGITDADYIIGGA